MHHQVTSRFSRNALIIGIVLLNLVVFSIGIYTIISSKQKVINKLELSTQSYAEILSRYLKSEIDKFDISLQTISKKTQNLIQTGSLNSDELNDFIEFQRMYHNKNIEFRVIDKDGYIRYGTNVSKPIFVGDRGYFLKARDSNSSELIVSEAIFSRVINKWVLVFAKKIELNGNFLGVTTSTISIEYINSILSKADLNITSIVALRNNKAELLAMIPVPNEPQKVYNTKINNKYAEAVSNGLSEYTYETIVNLDNRELETIFSLKKLENLPLYVIVGVSKDEGLSEWRKETLKIVSALIVFMFMSGILTAFLIRYLKQIERINKELLSSKNELEILNEQLNTFANSLTEQVESEVALRMKAEYEKRAQEALLIQRSKMADMGEMLGVILYQWKQPLNVISLYIDMIDDLVDENGKLEKEAYNDFKVTIKKQIEHMANTATLFKNFFSPSKEKELFLACEAIAQTLEILKAGLKNESIEIKINEHEHFHVSGYKNEFMHVILNIINNAKDAFKERDIKNGKIEINFENDGSVAKIRIRDNAGGIPQHLLPDKLFEAYVTTKGQNGTGIGLNLAKTIIEKSFDGKIWAYNVNDGAEFVIELPISKG